MAETVSRSDGFRTNVSRDENDPFLIVAKHLAQKIPNQVWIEDIARDSTGIINPNNVAVWATPEGNKLLEVTYHLPEFREFHKAASGDEPNTSLCAWTEEKKDRVIALFWTRKAEKYSGYLKSQLNWTGLRNLKDEDHLARVLIPEAKSIAQRMLVYSHQQPYTETEIRSNFEFLAECVLDGSFKFWQRF
jgi:hypothetical protein